VLGWCARQRGQAHREHLKATHAQLPAVALATLRKLALKEDGLARVQVARRFGLFALALTRDQGGKHRPIAPLFGHDEREGGTGGPIGPIPHLDAILANSS